jgi:HSP20 family protein
MSVKDLIPIHNWKKPAEGRSVEQGGSWSSLQKDLNRLFEGFFSRSPFAPFTEEEFGRISPRMDVRDLEDEYVVEMEIPGMSEKDISISLSNGLLTLSGEKKQESETKEGCYYCSERSFGRFDRSIPLEDEIDAEKVEAKFRNGLLKIRIPKKAPRKADTKRIPIKVE